MARSNSFTFTPNVSGMKTSRHDSLSSISSLSTSGELQHKTKLKPYAGFVVDSEQTPRKVGVSHDKPSSRPTSAVGHTVTNGAGVWPLKGGNDTVTHSSTSSSYGHDENSDDSDLSEPKEKPICGSLAWTFGSVVRIANFTLRSLVNENGTSKYRMTCDGDTFLLPLHPSNHTVAGTNARTTTLLIDERRGLAYIGKSTSSPFVLNIYNIKSGAHVGTLTADADLVSESVEKANAQTSSEPKQLIKLEALYEPNETGVIQAAISSDGRIVACLTVVHSKTAKCDESPKTAPDVVCANASQNYDSIDSEAAVALIVWNANLRQLIGLKVVPRTCGGTICCATTIADSTSRNRHKTSTSLLFSLDHSSELQCCCLDELPDKNDHNYELNTTTVRFGQNFRFQHLNFVDVGHGHEQIAFAIANAKSEQQTDEALLCQIDGARAVITRWVELRAQRVFAMCVGTIPIADIHGEECLKAVFVACDIAQEQKSKFIIRIFDAETLQYISTISLSISVGISALTLHEDLSVLFVFSSCGSIWAYKIRMASKQRKVLSTLVYAETPCPSSSVERAESNEKLFHLCSNLCRTQYYTVFNDVTDSEMARLQVWCPVESESVRWQFRCIHEECLALPSKRAHSKENSIQNLSPSISCVIARTIDFHQNAEAVEFVLIGCANGELAILTRDGTRGAGEDGKKFQQVYQVMLNEIIVASTAAIVCMDIAALDNGSNLIIFLCSLDNRTLVGLLFHYNESHKKLKVCDKFCLGSSSEPLHSAKIQGVAVSIVRNHELAAFYSTGLDRYLLVHTVAINKHNDDRFSNYQLQCRFLCPTEIYSLLQLDDASLIVLGGRKKQVFILLHDYQNHLVRLINTHELPCSSLAARITSLSSVPNHSSLDGSFRFLAVASDRTTYIMRMDRSHVIEIQHVLLSNIISAICTTFVLQSDENEESDLIVAAVGNGCALLWNLTFDDKMSKPVKIDSDDPYTTTSSVICNENDDETSSATTPTPTEPLLQHAEHESAQKQQKRQTVGVHLRRRWHSLLSVTNTALEEASTLKNSNTRVVKNSSSKSTTPTCATYPRINTWINHPAQWVTGGESLRQKSTSAHQVSAAPRILNSRTANKKTFSAELVQSNRLAQTTTTAAKPRRLGPFSSMPSTPRASMGKLSVNTVTHAFKKLPFELHSTTLINEKVQAMTAAALDLLLAAQTLDASTHDLLAHTTRPTTNAFAGITPSPSDSTSRPSLSSTANQSNIATPDTNTVGAAFQRLHSVLDAAMKQLTMTKQLAQSNSFVSTKANQNKRPSAISQHIPQSRSFT